jgi:transformation/transcription domain-associated protein
MRAQFKHLIPGLKVIVSSLRSISQSSQSGSNNTVAVSDNVDSDLPSDEVTLFIRLFREGFRCFDYYIIDHFQDDGLPPDWPNEQLDTIVSKLNNTASKEERDTLDQFASVFVLLEPHLFQEIFSSQIDFLFERIIVNPPVSSLPQTFLANEAVSYNFAGIMLRYLVDRMELVGSGNKLRGSTMVRMFRYVFMAISLFPDPIEMVLQHHIGNIIMTCMKLSMKSKEPLNYFYLLRALFRSIGGGRFELLYKEVLPLLQVLLERLNALLDIAYKPDVKELFVELCLTVPVRLSILLPYLSYLMKPLVLAIQSDSELVGQGLRTLELCIDNLTQEFLDPIVAPVIHELMGALYRHLKPLPYNHSHAHTTLRILGKLGGRNRRMLKDAPVLKYIENHRKGIELRLDFITHVSSSDTNHTLSTRTDNVLVLDESIESIQLVLLDEKASLFYKEHALNLLKGFLSLIVEAGDAAKSSGDFICRNIRARLQPPSSDDLSTDNMDIEPLPISQGASQHIADSILSQSTRAAKERALSEIIFCLFLAVNVPELKENAWSVLENLCNHFALLMVSETLHMMDNLFKGKNLSSPQPIIQDRFSNSEALGVNAFLDAIVEVMTCEHIFLRQFGEDGIIRFYDACLVILESKDVIGQLPVFHSLARKFCSSCYREEWFRKSGGCFGISIVACKLDLGTKWMLDHELELIRSLLYVLKDTSPEMATNNVDDATQVLSHILKVCHHPDLDDEADRQLKFNSIISLLITELSNANTSVRETIQHSFQLLADLTGTEVTDLLSPVRERLLAPIFTKPLRALPFAMQIGHIDAITYCLSLRPPLLKFNDDLLRLLHEALALADADDQALVSRTSQYKNASSLNNLRVVCIKLLSSAMACNDFLGPKQSHTRARIISVFFKSLYSKSPEVIEVANKGLKQVLSQQHKLPRDLLQAGLRPILMNLSNHKQLTVAGLEGLGRLLSLLTNYFKVEVGRKLLDHLNSWAEPQVFQESSGKPLSEVNEVKIVVAIIEVFHLLPPAANLFLDELVQTTLNLEKTLKRSISSPFRKPLLLFLKRYPKEAIDYFYGKFSSKEYMSLFCFLLGMESAEALRDQVMNTIDILMKHTFHAENKYQFTYYAIAILRQIAKYSPELISGNRSLLDCLIQHWNSPELHKLSRQEEFLGISRVREPVYLIEILSEVCCKNCSEPEVLFQLASIYCQDTVVPSTFFTKFIHEEVALKYTGPQKRRLLEYFLIQFEMPQVSQSLKVQMLRLIILPMLIVAFSRPAEHPLVIDRESIDLIHAKIWHQINFSPSEQSFSSDSLTVELLQLTSLILEHAAHLASDIRKDIIKFGWNYLKHDDMIVRQSANVLIAKFIAAYDTPTKIIIQIYVALLRANQTESRPLVKQALDVLTPVLPKRIANVGDSKFPTWLRWIRRIIAEDGHNIVQLVNIYQLMVRHPELFYPHCEHFFPHICNSLAKLAFNANANAETRLLTFDLAELLLKWERQRASSAETESNKYSPAMPIRETVINYLVRFICSTSEPIQKRGSAHRALELVKAFLSPEIWSDVPINLGNFERSLVQNEIVEANFSSVTNSLQVLFVCVKSKPMDWFVQQVAVIHKLLEKCLRSEDIVISRNLTPLLGKVYESVNDSLSQEKPPQEVTNFVTMVDGIIQDGLQSMTNLYSIMMILNCSCTTRPENLDQFMTLVARLSQKLTKDHITPPANSTPQSILIARDLLIISLKLLKSRIAHLTEQRRWFLTSLIQLIEKSTDEDLCRSLLEMVSDWVFKKSDAALPTIKEKANLLVKMMCFENLQDKSLIEEYLGLVADIYQNPQFARSELTVKLQSAFLLGTKYPKPEIRNRFTAIFDSSMTRSLFTRLAYIFGQQTWEYFGDSFYLQQALDMLMGTINENKPLSASTTGPKIVAIGELTKTNHVLHPDSCMETSFPGQEKLEALINSHIKFLKELETYTTKDIISPLRQLTHTNVDLTYNLWIQFFQLFWNNLTRRERGDFAKILVSFLAKEYHTKQSPSRPNVIEAILQAIARCTPCIRLPPHVIKYLGKKFNSWHIAVELLEAASGSVINGDTRMNKEEFRKIDLALDDLGEMYKSLCEYDMFYGLCKRRSLFPDTITAISLEQHGYWYEAQQEYENVQKQARNGAVSFAESEYQIWEDHWVYCTQKLQQFDCLLELGKHDNNTDLQLESVWRIWDWNAEANVVEKMMQSITYPTTPRLKFFDSFLMLIGPESQDKAKDITKKCDEGIQLLLQNWHSCPSVVGNTHVELLHTFQLYVEIQEATQIFNSLSSTKANNLDARSQDIKGILQTWRERLPNVWDDIHVWSDIISWRQHIFNAINKAYLPLIPQMTNNANGSNAGGSNNNSNTTSYSNAYRGYHETAWLINRFAHVSRKHRLIDVCITNLAKIYTLPNIEIQEAFLKLREQAKSHYQRGEYSHALDVINNTNMSYFTPTQKAEFYILKGSFLNKLDFHDEANQSYSSAIQMDFHMGKAWGTWGEYNDRMFAYNKTETSWGVSAINCYLHAAGIFKNNRSRKYIARILWLLSIDDESGTLAQSFDNYKGEMPVWYWITFIPQLISSLPLKDNKIARFILMKIAKSFPQVMMLPCNLIVHEFILL